jgi:hypothetical protein
MLQITPAVSCAVLQLLPARAIAHYCYQFGKQPTVSRQLYKHDCHVFVLPCLLDAKEVAEAHYANT